MFSNNGQYSLQLHGAITHNQESHYTLLCMLVQMLAGSILTNKLLLRLQWNPPSVSISVRLLFTAQFK
jgi:hypothetical protein